MSGVIAKAAEVVGAIVAVAAAIPTGGTSLLALGLGVSGAVATSIALATTLATSLIGTLAAKPPHQTVSPMAWQADPQAGVDIIFGRAYWAGKIVYRQTWGKDDKNETIVTAYSLGPVHAFASYYVDGVATTIGAGGSVNIADRGKMYVTSQLGAQPETRQVGDLGPPDWTTASKLSGLAATSTTFIYDAKGGTTFVTEPQTGWVIEGKFAYDARKDGSRAGGIGPQRIDDEATWAYTENPGVVGLTWNVGWRENGHLVAGVGAPPAGILIDQFVEWANICDANGWKLGGVKSTTDDKWDVFKTICQAGGAEPLRLGAQIGVLVNTPRVSLATIGIGDVVGDASVQTTQSRRDRLNAIVPRYMAEQSVTTQDSNGNLVTNVTWGITPGSAIVVPEYVAFDGKRRQREITYELVTSFAQVQQLARYDIENAREFGPITLPLKLRWMGYKPGDVVTADLPELGLAGQDVLLLTRSLSPQAGTVTMTARSETAGKHAYALGQTGTPPATPSVSGPPLVSTPGASAWALVGGEITSANGTTAPVLRVTGSADSDAIDAIVFEYREASGTAGDGDGWTGASTQPPATGLVTIAGVKDATAYQVAVSYRRNGNAGNRLILGPATAGETQVPWATGVAGAGKPQDNATYGAPSGTPIGSSTADAVIAAIASIQAAIDSTDLGDTGAANAAKMAAEAARDVAQAAQAAAEAARSQSQTARDAALAAEGLAETKATAADGSAQAAAGYGQAALVNRDAAGVSASAAQIALVSAKLATAQTFPSGFTPAERPYWIYDEQADPSNDGVVYDASWFGPAETPIFITKAGQTNVLATRGQFVPVIGRRYRITILIARFPGGSGASYGYYGFDQRYSDGSYGVAHYATVDLAALPTGVWTPLTFDWLCTETLISARPRIHLNWDGGTGTALSSHVINLKSLTFEDVTASAQAEAQASAAALSSSSAAISQTAAGNSASAAHESETHAETASEQAGEFAGTADTKAGEASVSESNAAASTSMAAIYRDQTATARDAAGGSAEAASDFASIAEGRADAAGSSATSAQGFSNEAQAHAIDAGTKADVATSQAAVASAASAAAQTSATLSAAYNRPRPNLIVNGSGENGLAGIGGHTGGWTTANSLWGPTFVSSAVPANGGLTWPLFDVQPGATYTISADTLLFATGGAVYLDILFLRADGSVAKDGDQRPRVASFDFSENMSGKDLIAVADSAPADAVKGQARFVWYDVAGLTAIGIRQLKAERGGLPWTGYDQSLVGTYEQLAVRATIDRVDAVAAAAESARASTQLALEADIAGVSGQVDTQGMAIATKASIDQLNLVAVTAENARASTDARLSAQLAGTTGSGLKSTIDDNAAAAVSATAAVASRTSSLEVTAGDLAARTSIAEGAIVDLKGVTQAYVDLVADAGGSVARISLVATKSDGTHYSRILLDADEIDIDGKLVLDNSVTGPKIAPDAVHTGNVNNFAGTSTSGLLTGWQTISTLDITVAAGDILVFVAGGTERVTLAASSGGITNLKSNMRIMRNGTTIVRSPYNYIDKAADAVSTLTVDGTYSITDTDMPGAGTFTYTMQITATNTGGVGHDVSASGSALDGTFAAIILKATGV